MINFILFILSIVLLMVFIPIGLAFTFLKAILKNDYYIMSSYYRELALGLDRFGNVIMGSFFTILFLKKTAIYKFGNGKKTISHVLGKNNLANTLSYFGRLLDKILNKIDNNHTINSIE